jgi:cobalt-zinc-cadmium efflux system membrane fusion protein
MRHTGIDVYLLLAGVLAISAGCSKAEQAGEPAAPKVSAATITYAENSVQLKGIETALVEAPRERELILPGRLTWDEDHTVRVFTPFAGRVSRLVASVGDRVAAGQVLAQMISPDFGQAQADARKAEADLSVKRQQWNRVKELAAAGISAAKDLQQAESDFLAAEAESKRAGSRLAVYGGGSHVDQLFFLKSPIAGVIVEKNINPGQELRPDQPGAPLFVVTDPKRLWVQLDANEADLKSLKAGTPIFVSSNQYPDDSFAGELKQVADFIDPQSRTLKLRGALPNAERRLKAEMFVSARINLPKGEYPSVPEKAVFLEGVRPFVFVKTAKGVFTRKGIRVGAASNGVMPVLAGLKEGDEVVVTGSLYLQQLLAAGGVKADAAESAKAETPAPAAKK